MRSIRNFHEDLERMLNARRRTMATPPFPASLAPVYSLRYCTLGEQHVL